MTFWIGTACAEHTSRGREGGFAQLGHGKHDAVKNLKKGDWIAYYSPTTKMGGGDKLQSFTTIGEVVSEEPYQVSQSADFSPWRVDVAYRQAAHHADIHPLLDILDLTRGLGSKWGMAVRAGKTKTSDADLQVIAKAMGVKISLFNTCPPIDASESPVQNLSSC